MELREIAADFDYHIKFPMDLQDKDHFFQESVGRRLAPLRPGPKKALTGGGKFHKLRGK